jgi:hypothetical protein
MITQSQESNAVQAVLDRPDVEEMLKLKLMDFLCPILLLFYHMTQS